MFSCNEAPIDRVIRVVLGLAILPLAFVGPHTPWAYAGLLPLLTGATGFCPLYKLVGLNGCTPKTGNPAA